MPYRIPDTPTASPSSSSSPFDAFLAHRRVMILDGALATELERRGADLRDPLWSARCLIDSPQLIRDVHRDYFAAGADVATTATYQATFEGFAGRGIGSTAAADLMRRAVALALEARDEFWAQPANRIGRLRPLVAASVGPYGAMLADGSEYRGHYAATDRELEDFHRPRLAVLATAGADVLACETIPCLREARVLARLIDEGTALRAWIAFSCQDQHHTCEGDDIGEVAAVLERHHGVAALGVNCTRPEFVASLIARMRDRTTKPLLAYPNSGEHYEAHTKVWAGERSAGYFADLAQSWEAAGARLMGGCCRTGPEDIAELHRRQSPA